ncbi:NAD(P)H-binding protein [Streptomyces flaveolus]|uniref:NAD(P)H-binding protein n=1 Tax=Streptomyces flaveolus TaxID=67297 RepID=UPI00370182C5
MGDRVIVVVGATGNVGRALVTQLAAEGRAVRGLTRDPSRAGLPDGVEPVRADFSRAGGNGSSPGPRHCSSIRAASGTPPRPSWRRRPGPE